MKKIYKNSLSVFLVIALMLSMALNSFAMELSSISTKQENPKDLDSRNSVMDFSSEIEDVEDEKEKNINNTSNEAVGIIEEEVDKREGNVKHYRQTDGTHKAVVYPYSVHYKDGENWEEIDNSLESNTTKKGSKIYSNKNNSMKVHFTESLNSDEMQMTVQQDKYELSWSVQNVDKDTEKVKAEVDTASLKRSSSVADISDNKAVAKLDSDMIIPEDQKVVEKLESSILYKSVLDGADLKYDVQPDRVKESIILDESPIDNPEYDYVLSYKNLDAKLKDDNSVVFTDTETGEEIFSILTPYMIDANGETSHEIEVSLKEEIVYMADISSVVDEVSLAPKEINEVSKEAENSNVSKSSINPELNFVSSEQSNMNLLEGELSDIGLIASSSEDPSVTNSPEDLNYTELPEETTSPEPSESLEPEATQTPEITASPSPSLEVTGNTRSIFTL